MQEAQNKDPETLWDLLKSKLIDLRNNFVPKKVHVVLLTKIEFEQEQIWQGTCENWGLWLSLCLVDAFVAMLAIYFIMDTSQIK